MLLKTLAVLGVTLIGITNGKVLSHSFKNEVKVDVKSQVSFHLYTRYYFADEVITLDPQTLKDSYFDPKKETKILVHGYMDNRFSVMPQTLKNNYLNVSDVNVIVVDWGKIAKHINYFVIIPKVPLVAEYVGEFLNMLVDYGCDPASIHMVGHSLGAHISGVAADLVQKGKIGRITGLDPAKPKFSHVPEMRKVDKSDASFVDIIHTCGGVLGLFEPLGHVDFYPNGGRNTQPGCHLYDFGKCSHQRSYQFFGESILPGHVFQGLKCELNGKYVVKCDSNVTQNMGNYVSRDARGVFFVSTGDRPPFSNKENKPSGHQWWRRFLSLFE